nr:MAG TPA: hypothetical protein [Caudoviricetes sp.]
MVYHSKKPPKRNTSAALSMINQPPCRRLRTQAIGTKSPYCSCHGIHAGHIIPNAHDGLVSFLQSAILNQISLSYLYAIGFGSSERNTLGWKPLAILLTILDLSRLPISYASRT